MSEQRHVLPGDHLDDDDTVYVADADNGAVSVFWGSEAELAAYPFGPEVTRLARVADDLGQPVMCYGLRVDFRGELFPGSAALFALADDLREVRTICHCGRKATMVVRQDEHGRALHEGAQVQIGGNDTNTSLCRRHWREAMGEHS